MPLRRRSTRSVLVLFALALLASCECNTGPTTQPSPPEIRAPESEDESAEPEPEAAASSQFFATPQTRLEPPTEAQAQAFATQCNRLGLALYGLARAREAGNFAISPASITLAFDMVYGGAGGETATEMARVMGISGSAPDVHEAAGRVLSRWNDPDREDYELRVVNRLFGEESFDFEQDYLTLTRTQYGAPFEGVDFMNDPDAERQRINLWVAEQTQEHITDLLPEPAVTTATRLVVVNAVYFLGRWLSQFDPDQTVEQPFTLADGESVDVPLMRQTDHLRHVQTDGVTVVELPYRGSELAMTLVIPDAPRGLSAVEARLDADTFRGWTSGMRAGEVRLVMPRFEMKTKTTLADDLKTLGMEQAFDARVADFYAIGRPENPARRLYISEAFHQVFVLVDEVGTEAAAATAVVMASGGGMPQEPVEIRADRPFIFAIREVSSGAILFIGRVADPR